LDLNGRRGRIDHCYPPEKLVLEALGYEWHVKLRERWDDDRFRGNELRLAGFSVLEFTSAFTDWQIAEQVARGLGDLAPRRPKREQKYAQWKVRRDRRSA
jgi:very-short-patch-repair endonuclease